jgi:hypothetical protein
MKLQFKELSFEVNLKDLSALVFIILSFVLRLVMLLTGQRTNDSGYN